MGKIICCPGASEKDLLDINKLLGELSRPPIDFDWLQTVMAHSNLFLARDSETDRVVGMATLTFRHNLTDHILGTVDSISVLKEYRDQGIDEALIRAINLNRPSNMTHIDIQPIHSAGMNIARLCRKLGFEGGAKTGFRLVLK